jgi:hypothetical protein
MKKVAALFRSKKREKEEEKQGEEDGRDSLSALPHTKSKTQVLGDGTKVRTDRAGSKVAELPNGCTISMEPSLSVTTIRESDGRSTSLEKSGSQVVRTKDGTKKHTDRFGQITRSEPDGTVAVHSLRGSITTRKLDGSQRIEYTAAHESHSEKSSRTLSTGGTDRTFGRSGTVVGTYKGETLEVRSERGSITRTLSAKGKGMVRQSSWRVHKGGHAAEYSADNRRKTKISLNRKRRNTAKQCLAEGCDVLHRYDDHYCHLHGHLAVLSLCSDGQTINMHESCKNLANIVEKTKEAHTRYIICSTPEEGADGPKDAKERSFTFKTMNHVKALSESAMYSKSVTMGFDFQGSSNTYAEDDKIW